MATVIDLIESVIEGLANTPEIKMLVGKAEALGGRHRENSYYEDVWDFLFSNRRAAEDFASFVVARTSMKVNLSSSGGGIRVTTTTR